MTDAPSDNPVRLMIGNAVIGMGIIWIALCGLCSAWMMGEFLLQGPFIPGRAQQPVAGYSRRRHFGGSRLHRHRDRTDHQGRK
jgi:hypothetical protein